MIAHVFTIIRRKYLLMTWHVHPDFQKKHKPGGEERSGLRPKRHSPCARVVLELRVNTQSGPVPLPKLEPTRQVGSSMALWIEPMSWTCYEAPIHPDQGPISKCTPQLTWTDTGWLVKVNLYPLGWHINLYLPYGPYQQGPEIRLQA